jgi:hypothetical protein
MLRASSNALRDLGDDRLHVGLQGCEHEHSQRVRELLDEVIQAERLENSLDA